LISQSRGLGDVYKRQSLFTRFASRQDDSPAMKAVAALRNQFGGHAVKKAD
jgi:6-phosphogluconate dehydrogenase